MCESTVPRLDAENPILATTKVAAYWAKIQTNEFAAKILDEMRKGLEARLDGSEARLREELIARSKASQT